MSSLIRQIPLYGIALALPYSISITQFFFAASLLLWLFDFIRKEKRFSNEIAHEYFLLFIIGFWVIYRIFHVLYSSMPERELVEMREVWLFLMIPLITVRAWNETVMVRLLTAAAVGAALPGIYGLILAQSQNVFSFSFRFDAFGGMNPLTYTQTSGILIFVLAGFAGYLLARGRWLLAGFVLLALVLDAFGFTISKSRGGFLALAFSGGVAALIILRRWSLLLIPLAVFILGTLYQAQEHTGGFFEKLFTSALSKDGSQYGSWLNRLQQWEGGMRMWFDHPFLGTGIVDYKNFWPDYVLPEYTERWSKITDPAKVMHLHNDVLDTLVMFGLLGFTILYTIITQPLVDFFRLGKKAIPSVRILLFSIVLAVVFFLVSGLSQAELLDSQAQTALWFALGIFYRALQIDISQADDI